MNKTETQALLKQIALIDNRKVTPETIEAWHGIVGIIPFDIASEALTLARKDASINWLEPRHIVAWAKEAAYRNNRSMPIDLLQTDSAPAPICEHEKPIARCLPCCRQLSESLG